MPLIGSSAKTAHGQLCIERAITHTATQFAYKIQLIAKNCMYIFCAVFRKLGPKDINPFFWYQITFYYCNQKWNKGVTLAKY